MRELLKHFYELSLHPKNAKELKGLILQLAIQGKLTADWRAQHTELVSGENSAENLLSQINAEKELLIKEKKIKKEKDLQPITEDEIPFGLPKSWAWCRLNEVCEYIQRGKSPKYTEDPKIPVISQKCIQWSGFDIERARFITEESLEKYGVERFLQNGDLLWNSTGDGTIGRVISYPGSKYERVVADSHVTVVRGFKEYIDSEYLWIFTASPLIQDLIAGRVTGSTKQTELGTGTVKLMEFSFPPLEEQKAIVAVVNKLFKEVEQLEELTKARISLKKDFVTSALQRLTEAQNTNQVWRFLQQQFASFFTEKANIKKLRETVLQLAVQGKLTAKWREANPNLEPASQLIKRIQAEKQQLIAEKKIKKEKPLPPIEDKDKPYELPDGWVWCRLNEVCEYIQRGKSPKYTGESKIPVISQKCVQWSGFDMSRARFITEESLEKYDPERFLQVGDLLWNSTGNGTIGRVISYPDSQYEKVVADSHVTVVRGFKKYINTDYLWIFTACPLIQKLVDGRVTGSTNQTELGTGTVKLMEFSFPPLEEQKAIVKKVNSLMALCDDLETQIDNSQTQIEHLMQSCLKEVFEREKKGEHSMTLAAELGTAYEKNKDSLDALFDSLNYDCEVAAVILLTGQRFGHTYGKKYIHKMFSNIQLLDELPVFKELQFKEHGWGMFSPILQKTIENEVFVEYRRLDNGKNTLQIKSKAIPEVSAWINQKDNKEFVNQINNMLTIYEKPLIERSMDRIELLNTVLECMVILETDNLKRIRTKMESWEMFEGNYKTKAEKFTENETLHMIHLIKGLRADLT